MEATNSLNIFTPTHTRVVEVATPPKVNPPSLKEALHIVSPKLLPFALRLLRGKCGSLIVRALLRTKTKEKLPHQ